MSRGYYRGKPPEQSPVAYVQAEPTFQPTPDKAQSRAKGYTGDPCTNCQSLTLRVSGHCYVCDTCGETTGCS